MKISFLIFPIHTMIYLLQQSSIHVFPIFIHIEGGVYINSKQLFLINSKSVYLFTGDCLGLALNTECLVDEGQLHDLAIGSRTR